MCMRLFVCVPVCGGVCVWGCVCECETPLPGCLPWWLRRASELSLSAPTCSRGETGQQGDGGQQKEPSRRNQVQWVFKAIVHSAPASLVRRTSIFWCPGCPAERSEVDGMEWHRGHTHIALKTSIPSLQPGHHRVQFPLVEILEFCAIKWIWNNKRV